MEIQITSSKPSVIKFRVYVLNLETCDKLFIGYFNNRFDAIKRAHRYRLLNNEAIIVQELINGDPDADKWYTVHSKVKRR